jgi:FtsP/CotA-like multicopper oxidase with cupredoxin domain
MKRRDFLKNSALTLGAIAVGGREVIGQEMQKGHAMPGMAHEGMEVKREEMMIHEPIGWADPGITISPPPPLMGKQMGRVHTPNVLPLGHEMDGNVKVFTLIAQPVEQFIHEGIPPEDSLWYKFHKAKGMQPDMFPSMFLSKKIKGWGFNGSIPGPTVEVFQGDRVRLIVKNELPEPTSIHWHGIELPNEMDGVGGLTQPPIMPGETFIYEFTLYQSGTFFYHSAFNEMKQVGMGLGGSFVIHPKKEKYKVDKDFVIVMNEWKLLPGNENPDVTSTNPDWFTFNGKAAPSTEILEVKQGDRVRIRFINFSNQNDHPIHIHGHTWWVVGTEAGPIPKSAQWPGNTVDVPAGSSRDVEFVAWNPGYWQLHCHKLHHIMNAEVDMPMGVMPMGGLTTILNVIPRDRKAKWRHPKEGGGYE